MEGAQAKKSQSGVASSLTHFLKFLFTFFLIEGAVAFPQTRGLTFLFVLCINGPVFPFWYLFVVSIPPTLSLCGDGLDIKTCD